VGLEDLHKLLITKGSLGDGVITDDFPGPARPKEERNWS
jgi:hypothetical protein